MRPLQQLTLLPLLPFALATGETVDVAVIGAGLSGLSAARALLDAGKTVRILEARDRVGGRVQNFPLSNGGTTELGAAFVGPTQDRVLALADELGLETFLEYNTGNNVLVSQGQRTEYDAAGLPQLDLAALLQFGTLLGELDAYAAGLDVNAPWSSPNASLWDDQTFATFLDTVVTDPAPRGIVDTATKAIWSAGPEELSLLYVLAYIASAGNETTPGTFERLIGATGGAQESRIVGGTGLLGEGLADRIGRDKIVFNAPVRSVTASEGGYTVTAENTSVDAKDVIVAMSPPLAARIVYEPQIPAMRDQLTQRLFMGALGKAIAVYDTPFWRDANQTGQAVADSGTTRATYDDSPEDASYGAILGFLLADQMRALDAASEDEITALVAKDLVNYFGPEAANVKQWVVKRWDNEIYSRGAPTALAGPGTLSKYGPALRESFGGLHWAGTEAADYWTGYMDGAIRSGERAAREVIGA